MRLFCLRIFVLLGVLSGPLFAQNNPPGQGGILIDPQGVISAAPGLKRSEQLSEEKLLAAAGKSLPADLNRESSLRLVSLPSLEAECRRLIDAGEELSPEVLHLAGLQRIDYVFVYPETNDLVIGGPADGFAPNKLNVPVGVHSGRPVLRLEDVLAAFQSRAPSIGCSIDPVPNRMAAVNRYLQSSGAAPSVSAARARYQEMVDILGNQTVSVFGVQPDSRFARVLVEADFRMKMLSVGKERSRVRGFKSYLALKEAGTNTLRRWWFAPLYEPVDRNEDKSAWKLNGQRVQVLAQDELLAADGTRRNADFTKVSTTRFARQFTEKYTELAERSSIFAELQNLFDIAIVTALIREEGLAARIGWTMELFAEPGAIEVREYNVPRMAPSIANSRKAGRLLVVGVVGGGVQIHPVQVWRGMRMNVSKQVADLRQHAIRPRVEAQPDEPPLWWWDAEPIESDETESAK